MSSPETAICIASGPSLTQEDVDYCRGRGRIYAVNDVYRLAPWADVLFACDLAWWKRYGPVLSFSGLRLSTDKNACEPRQQWNVHRVGLDRPSDRLNLVR